ncbi:MAG: hypothetical protein NTY51_04645 [Deltaproteobacteria bacterium]|jgi:hypothetical protein|nr:hypothetical protein [Deltaproteobacteria bacterium]
MSLRFIASLLFVLTLLTLPCTNDVYSDNSMGLNVCQELVNNARGYESRATWHNRVAQGLMQQIQNMAKQPQNPGTAQVMDNLFQQYDQNRQMETQMRQLFRQYSDQAQQCMKSVN